MDIAIIEPTHPLLKPYIAYYYEATLSHQKYMAFPHYNTPVSFIRTVQAEVEPTQIVFREADERSQFLTVSKFVNPLLISAQGKVHEFCIVFKPFGLAQFLEDKLQWPSESVDLFSVFEDFDAMNPQFFSWDTATKMHCIEAYLLSRLRRKEGTNTIEKALMLMTTSNRSIAEIADSCCCSPKKLQRLFRALCGSNPSTYRKIIRFRQAVEQLKRAHPNLNLTDIALRNGYYDQPYFNNEFRKLTGVCPSQFFKATSNHLPKSIYFKAVK